MVKERKSNFELLRIVAILFIISFHYVYHSGYVFNSLNINSLIIESFYFLGELGVNLFILITGYFQVKGKFSGKKLIKLIIEVNFYNIIIVFAYHYLNGSLFYLITSKKDMILLFFSVIFQKYWFISYYIVLYILSPFINKIIKNMSKVDFQKILLVSLLIFCVIPTIFGFKLNNPEAFGQYNRFVWFIILYLLGAYIRLYSLKLFSKKKNTILIAIVSFMTMVFGIIIIYTFKDIFVKIGTTEVAYFWHPNSIPMLLLSVAIFELFKNMELKYNKVINKIASTTLAIYILHDNALSSFLWTKVFKNLKYLNSKYYLFGIIISTLIIFTVGMIVDLIRQQIEKITVNKFLESKTYKNIEQKWKKITTSILNFV